MKCTIASTGRRRGVFNPLEDFHSDDKLAELLDYYGSATRRGTWSS